MREPEADGLKSSEFGAPVQQAKAQATGIGDGERSTSHPPPCRNRDNQPTTGRGLARIPSLGKQALSGEREKGQSWAAGFSGGCRSSRSNPIPTTHRSCVPISPAQHTQQQLGAGEY